MNKPGNRQSSVQPQSPPSAASKVAALKSVGVSPPQSKPKATKKVLPPGAELQRTDSRNSINFSYPRPQSPPATRPLSPPATSPTVGGRTLSPQPARNGISAAEAERVRYDMINVAQQPVKKKKKKVAPQSTEGSYLQEGSMASRPIVTPLEPGPERTQEDLQPQPIKKKKKKQPTAAAVSGPSTHFPPSPVSTQDSDEDSTPEKQRRAQRASGVLAKQPSIVREDWEGEQEEQDQSVAQYREEQGMSPSSIPVPVQGKKASANTSRKIEEQSGTPPQRTLQPSAVSSYHAVTSDAPPQQHTNGVQGSSLAVKRVQQERGLSHSPSRTRFSDRLSTDIAAGGKHEPLPRSVSPSKSALKHSAEGSPSGLRIGHARGSSTSPSEEASDSNISADGSVRRKKSARVSFQPAPEIVGTSAQAETLESPVTTPPKEQKRGFFGFGRTKPALTTIPSDDGVEEHMKPRPQLPTFGSMRDRTRRTDSSEAVPTTSSPQATRPLTMPAVAASSTSSDTSSSTLQPNEEGASTDQLIGSLLSREATIKAPAARDPNMPLPPEVTSVEGTGYASETESEVSVDNRRAALPTEPAASISHPTMKANAQPAQPQMASTAPEMTGSVPALAVQPPTPGQEEVNPADLWQVEVPGMFPGEEESDTPVRAADNKGLGIAEPSIPAPTPATQRTAPTQVESEDESASDNDSIYSDTAEDPSQLDGDGFGSINAIMESPIIDSPARRITTPPQSPLGKYSQTRPEEPMRTASWEQAQQRWSGIAQQTRQSTTQAGASSPQQSANRQATMDQVVTSSPVQTSVPMQTSSPIQTPTPMQTSSPLQPSPQLSQPKPKPKKKKTYAAGAAALAAAPQPASIRPATEPPKTKAQRSSYTTAAAGQPNQNRDAPLKSSMRGQQNVPAPRTGANASNRISMRNASEQAGRAAVQPTRVSQPPASPPVQKRAALQKKHIPPAASPPKQVAPVKKPAPVPVNNDSDSESSFQKSRRRKASPGGQYSMRRSMRAASVEPQNTRVTNGRNAVRSLSPPVRRPFSPPPNEKPMRSTMRGSMDTSAPTLRNQGEQKRSSSLFGRSKRAKSPARATPMLLNTPIPSSRLADSDDEDKPSQRSFHSRYDDSSDEEEAKPSLTPVRGIPRKTDEGDSTDLDDSSDEGKQTTKTPSPLPKLNTTMHPSPGASDAPVSPNTAKKRGLFGMFKSKKEKDENSRSKLGGTIKERNATLAKTQPAMATARGEDKVEDKAQDSEGDDVGAGVPSNMGFGSAAERDAMIAQTMAKLEAQKSQESGSQSSTVAKPQRPPPERIMSDSWPLVPKIPSAEDDRPSSADPVSTKTIRNGVARPGMKERVFSNETDVTAGGTPVYGRSGKKKRFPMLRKAFGLKD